jgi:serine/threonine-protein kinase
VPGPVEPPAADDAFRRELASTRVIGDDPTLTSSAPAAPVTVAGFELIEKIGEGAMAAVYRARRGGSDHDVALKVLFSHVARNPKLVERLYREARAMSRLDHPGIVRAYAVGEDQGCPYVAMEFVEGQNLQKWLEKLRRLSVGDAVHITLACARALAYAHRQGLVHRDVKPENILITRTGAVKLADLGMVKNFDDDRALTQTGYAVGTPWYMPLEQAKNSKDTDGRCDIYALGCTLYCLLTGSPPFAAGSIVEVIRAKELGTFPPARAANPEVPDRLDLIIARMTAKQPHHRYATCEEIVRDLEALGLASPSLSLLAGEPEMGGRAGSGGDAAVDRFSSDAEPDRDVWYVRLRGPGGRFVLRRYRTARLRQKLVEGSIDPRAQVSHRPDDGFRSLATYRQFQGPALSRVTWESADKSGVRYRELYDEFEDKARRREQSVRGDDADWPPWAGLALRLGGLTFGVLLLWAFLYYIATGLAR